MKRFIPAKVKDLIIKLFKSKSTTSEIADGLAIGMFVAILPIMGIQMYVALVLTGLFRKNTIVALIAVWVTNPFTAAPIYLFNLWVGNLIYRKGISFGELYYVVRTLDFHNILGIGKDVLIPLWIGSIVMGLIAAFVSQRICLAYYDGAKNRLSSYLHHEN